MTEFRSEVSYYWVVEQLDEYGDIIDTSRAKSLKAAISADVDFHSKAVALVRDLSNDWEGLIDRGHAYLAEGKIPGYFDSGHKVPLRYINQAKNKQANSEEKQ